MAVSAERKANEALNRVQMTVKIFLQILQATITHLAVTRTELFCAGINAVRLCNLHPSRMRIADYPPPEPHPPPAQKCQEV